MSLRIDDYVNVLLSNEVSTAELEKAKKILFSSEELLQILNSPSVSPQEKRRVVSEIFSASVKGVITALSEQCHADKIKEVLDAYTAVLDRKNSFGVLKNLSVKRKMLVLLKLKS